MLPSIEQWSAIVLGKLFVRREEMVLCDVMALFMKQARTQCLEVRL